MNDKAKEMPDREARLRKLEETVAQVEALSPIARRMLIGAWDASIEARAAAGWTEDEISDEIARTAGEATITPTNMGIALVPIQGLRNRHEIERYVHQRLAGRGAAEQAQPDIERRPPRPGPPPLLTKAQVDKKRAELAADGLPCGERSLAAALGASRDAVRSALGKERQRKPRA